MKTKTKLLAAFIGLLIFYTSCATKKKNGIHNAEWLIGMWVNQTQEGSIYETWAKTNDSEFSGKSYFLKDKDTIFLENIRLVQAQNGLFYIPTVKNQNDGLPVRFTGKTITEKQLVFQNPQHDFPQIISYTKVGSDTLVAEISGTQNGRGRKGIFPMKRVKQQP